MTEEEAHLVAPRFRGVYPVLVTPFLEDGAIDWGGLGRQVEYQVRSGVAGVVCLGLASEVYKLSDAERDRIVKTVVEAASGAVEVVAGTEHSSTEAAANRAVLAAESGATALMMFPPSFIPPEPSQVVNYYARVAGASPLPIIIQDAPAWTRVTLPLEVLTRIRDAAPTASHVKVEAPPTAKKMMSLRRAGIEPLGGYGTLYLMEELDAGVVATMPGSAYPAGSVRMLSLFESGRRQDAFEIFQRLLPLTVFAMTSLEIFVAVQKLLLARMGVIQLAGLREPGVRLGPEQTAWLDYLVTQSRLEEFGVTPGV